jgi:GDPmannose 4,6-dehydratase
MPTALITGIGGQDGSFLAELLLQAGYRVVGLVRNASHTRYARIEHLRHSIELTESDLLDQCHLERVLEHYGPREVYNLAAYHPASSEVQPDPVLIGNLNGLAVVRWLEAVRKVDPAIRFFQAASAQIFGLPRESPQNEETPWRPNNPYGIAKLYALCATRYYREVHGLFACSGILFNHESPRRAEKFVTRKITLAVARIKAGLQETLHLENLGALRDWGYAKDYAKAMWLMLRTPTAADYVLATGQSHSVREFCELAFDHVGLDYKDYVVQRALSPCDSDTLPLVGDPRRAQKVLRWNHTLTFKELITAMVDADMALIESS